MGSEDTSEAEYSTKQEKKVEDVSTEEKKVDNSLSPSSKLKTDEKWDICCSRSSKGFIMFMVQTGVLMSVLLFSLFMLADDKTVQRDLYVSLLSSVVGIYLPSPQLPLK